MKPLGGLGENNGRPKQAHSEPVGDYFFRGADRSPSSGFRSLFPKKEESESVAARGYSAEYIRAHRQRLAEEERRESSPANTLNMVAAGSAAAGVATSALLGSSLLPALLITSGVTGIFVGYQYFTKTGLFKEPAPPMLPAQETMMARNAAPAQQMQAMMGSEEARLAAERAQLGQTVSIVSPEIEVPQTPSVQKSEKPLPPMMPRGGNKGLS